MRLFAHDRLVISIEEVQGRKYIKEKWSGVLNASIFHKLIHHSLDLYRQHLPSITTHDARLLLLADVTRIEIISPKDIEWLTEEINPIYEQLGFTHQAVLVPKSQIAQHTVSEYEGISGNFITKMFVNELDGVRWFLEGIKTS